MKRFAVALLSLLALTGTATAQSKPPLAVNWGYISSTAYYWDVFAAIELGFTKEEGVDVKSTRIDSASQAIQTLVTGAVDIVSVPAELVIAAAEKGGGVVAIATETDRVAFSLITQPDIRSYADLRGKSIGVTQLNEAAATMVRLLLKKHGLEAGDYDLIALGGTPNRYAALVNGAVGGALLSQPLDFKAVTEGKNKLGDTFEAFDGHYLVFASTSAWAQANAEAATRFLRATIRGSRWLYDPKNREAAIAILVKAIKATPDDAAKTYDFYFGEESIMARDLELKPERLQPYLDIRKSADKPERFIDLRYLNAALGH